MPHNNAQILNRFLSNSVVFDKFIPFINKIEDEMFGKKCGLQVTKLTWLF